MDEWRGIQRNHYFLKSFDGDLGLICFSEIPDSTLMWSYYASSHTGLVFGFDTEKLPDTIQNIMGPDTFLNIMGPDTFLALKEFDGPVTR